MVSINSKTQTFTNGTPNDAGPVDSEFVAAFNNDAILADALTMIEQGNLINATTLTINSAYTGGTPGNMALMAERGSLANTGFRWHEEKDFWEVTHNGSDYYPVSLVVATDPTALVEGMAWYNTTDNAMRYYDGAAKITIPTLPGQSAQAGKVLGTTGSALQWETLLISKAFHSDAQIISSGATLTIPHGLGMLPKITHATLKCTAAEFGWSVGDELAIGGVQSDGAANTAGVGLQLYIDTTNIYALFGNASNVFRLFQKSTGAQASLSNANWQLYIHAFS